MSSQDHSDQGQKKAEQFALQHQCLKKNQIKGLPSRFYDKNEDQEDANQQIFIKKNQEWQCKKNEKEEQSSSPNVQTQLRFKQLQQKLQSTSMGLKLCQLKLSRSESAYKNLDRVFQTYKKQSISREEYEIIKQQISQLKKQIKKTGQKTIVQVQSKNQQKPIKYQYGNLSSVNNGQKKITLDQVIKNCNNRQKDKQLPNTQEKNKLQGFGIFGKKQQKDLIYNPFVSFQPVKQSLVQKLQKKNQRYNESRKIKKAHKNGYIISYQQNLFLLVVRSIQNQWGKIRLSFQERSLQAALKLVEKIRIQENLCAILDKQLEKLECQLITYNFLNFNQNSNTAKQYIKKLVKKSAQINNIGCEIDQFSGNLVINSNKPYGFDISSKMPTQYSYRYKNYIYSYNFYYTMLGTIISIQNLKIENKYGKIQFVSSIKNPKATPAIPTQSFIIQQGRCEILDKSLFQYDIVLTIFNYQNNVLMHINIQQELRKMKEKTGNTDIKCIYDPTEKKLIFQLYSNQNI